MAEHEEPDDEVLLLAWRGGDRRAGSILLGRHYHRIARFFCAHHHGDWEELTQSTFLGCVEGIQRFRGEASFATFIFAIAHKKLLKQLRDQSRGQRRVDWVDLGHDVANVWQEAPRLQSEISQRVLATLRTLPNDTQDMLELHYWEDESIRAIAARFGLPEGTIKARLHRGRRQLMAEFPELTEPAEELEIMRSALELWADELTCRRGHDEAENFAPNATTRVQGEQSVRHEQLPPSLETLPLSHRRSDGARGHRL